MPSREGAPSPAGDNVAVTVLVPVLNEHETIAGTATAIVEQESPGAPLEFIFIDGGSTDGTRAVLDSLAASDERVRVLGNPKGVPPAGLNVGLAAARGRFVARMDAHTHYPPHYIRCALERLQRGDVASVSGPQLPQGHGAWSGRIARALESPLGRGGAAFRREIDREIEVDSAFTGMWPRDLLVRLGGWDESAYPNEDGELAARIAETGGRLVCLPELSARYVPRDSLGALATQYWRYGQSRVRTAVIHPTSLRRSHLAPPAVVLAAGAALAPSRGVRRLGRGGLALYCVALAGASLLDHAKGRGRDAILLPAVFATMHLAWGAGFLEGCRRFGIPSRALLHASLGRSRRVT